MCSDDSGPELCDAVDCIYDYCDFSDFGQEVREFGNSA